MKKLIVGGLAALMCATSCTYEMPKIGNSVSGSSAYSFKPKRVIYDAISDQMFNDGGYKIPEDVLLHKKNIEKIVEGNLNNDEFPDIQIKILKKNAVWPDDYDEKNMIVSEYISDAKKNIKKITQ